MCQRRILCDWLDPDKPSSAPLWKSFLSRPRAGRYFIWRLFRSKEDARQFLRKHKVADVDLEGWIATAMVEKFEDLVGPASWKA